MRPIGYCKHYTIFHLYKRLGVGPWSGTNNFGFYDPDKHLELPLKAAPAILIRDDTFRDSVEK